MKDLRNVLACIGAFVLATLHIQGKPMLVLLLFSFLFAHFICGYTYTWKNFKSALKEHWVSILLVFGIPFITLFIALYPFTLRPSGIEIWRDGFFYYFLVGCIEELMCRGFTIRSFFTLVKTTLFCDCFIIAILWSFSYTFDFWTSTDTCIDADFLEHWFWTVYGQFICRNQKHLICGFGSCDSGLGNDSLFIFKSKQLSGLGWGNHLIGVFIPWFFKYCTFFGRKSVNATTG